MSINMGRLRSLLILEEGLKLIPYRDTKGKLTTGVGRNLDDNPLTASEIALIGHDGREAALTHDQALTLLDNDIRAVCETLDQYIYWWSSLDDVRARVMIDLCFNMGIGKLLAFKHFLIDLKTGSYTLAADDLVDSLWYNQVGSRARRLTAMIRTGADWVI